jgi:hypothetical protein
VQGKALHARTAGTREPWCLALGAKARANAADLLSSPLAKGEALLHRGGHGASERGSVVTQGVIAGRHSGSEARFQVPQLAELAHDPMADLRDDRGNIGIGGRLACDKAWHEARLSAIEVDALKEDAMAMEVHIDGTAKALDKGHDPGCTLSRGTQCVTAWFT